MIKINFNDRLFYQDMENITEYSIGFLDGINKGKSNFLNNLGTDTIELLKDYVDTNARVNPQMLHHMYEWNQVGSPEARLFDIFYTVSNLGLSFKSTFSQSKSIKMGSDTPFYDKAKIMEEGIPVTIKPKKSDVLVFDNNGETIFTKNPITVDNPGGNVQGEYEKVFDTFFLKYFTQAFLSSSGIKNYLESPTLYKTNFSSGKRSGKSKGVETGFKWIANAGVVR